MDFDEPLGYEDVEQQVQRTQLLQDPTTAADANLDPKKSAPDLDPAGGLGAGEVAELVGWTAYTHAYQVDAGNTAASYAFYEHQWGTMDQAIDILTQSTADGEGSRVNTDGPVDNVGTRILYHSEVAAPPIYQNSTDGSGGAAGQYQTEEQMNYRFFFDHGPIFTRNEQLRFFTKANVKGAHDMNSEHNQVITFYWNVIEGRDIEDLLALLR